MELPDYISVDTLAKAFKVDMGALRVLNPALRPPIWSGSRLVPRGYRLRLPGAQGPAELDAGWARLPLNQRYVAQRNDGTHKLRRGETLAGVAAASGISLSRLLAANGWSSASAAGRGTVVHIPCRRRARRSAALPGPSARASRAATRPLFHPQRPWAAAGARGAERAAPEQALPPPEAAKVVQTPKDPCRRARPAPILYCPW